MTDIYKGADPRDLPAYSIAEATQYLGVSASTLRSWVVGRSYPSITGDRYFKPLITLPDPDLRQLSFTNLVEAHVLAATRRKYGVKLQNIRSAVDYLRKHYQIDHPLADARLKTDGLSLFIENLGEIVNVTMQGQIAMREIIETHLQRVEHDKEGLASRLFPFTRHGQPLATQPRSVVIDPLIAFGRPVLAGTGIPTAVLVSRYKAGESIIELADDYRCEQPQIEEAIRCEIAA